jgi:hypothetical protein
LGVARAELAAEADDPRRSADVKDWSVIISSRVTIWDDEADAAVWSSFSSPIGSCSFRRLG